MQKKSLRILLLLALSIGFASLSFAQRQTGSLAGKVVDEKKEPLPGVSVMLSGPVLQGTLTFVTTEAGAYRFPVLLPGANYVITFSLSGFNTLVQKEITISVGTTVTADVTLTQATLTEEVTVIAPTPAIDATSSKNSVTFTKALLESIPMNRNIYLAINSAPGMLIGSTRYSSAHGTDIYQTVHNLDGVSINDPVTHLPYMSMSTDMIEEIQIELGGHPAEVGGVAGAMINIVTSSGGNKFHGNANLYYFNKSFVDKNFSKEQLDYLGIGNAAAQDLSVTDAEFTLGGSIFKDKLWFFVNGGYLYRKFKQFGFPVDIEPIEWKGMFKLTARISKNLNLMVYSNYFDYSNDKQGATQWLTLDATKNMTSGTYSFNSRLNWTLSQNAFLDIRLMQIKKTTNYFSDGHYVYDRGTGMTSGNYSFQESSNRDKPLILSSSLTLFVDNFLGGNHEFKTGADLERVNSTRTAWTDAPIYEYTSFGSPYYYGENIGQFRALVISPKQGETEEADIEFKYSFFAQDSWTIGRFTLNLGARYDSQHATFPAQTSAEVPYWTWLDPEFFSKKEYPERKDVTVWNTFSPRVGLVFDLFGKGKTIAKVFYGRYHTNLVNTFWSRVNPNRVESYIVYRWTDNNMNGMIDPGDTYKETMRSGRGNWDPRQNIDPAFRCPFTDTINIGIEHELMPNFKFGISFESKTQNDSVKAIERDRYQHWAKSFTVTDPGYDGVFGTGDDQTLTVYDRTEPFVDYYLTNLPEAWRKYRGLEFIFEKRFSNKWQFLASITWSKAWGTTGLFGNLASTYGFETPNELINNEGRLDFDKPLQIKLQATYQLPYGINLSGYFVNMSGDTFTRMLDVYAPGAGGYVRIMAEPKGTRRQPSWNRLDLRLGKEFVFGDLGRLGVFIDAYNALNVATITTNNTIHGYIEKDGKFRVNPTWKTTSSTSEPRVIKLGLRFSF
jgi:hypothetical protein